MDLYREDGRQWDPHSAELTELDHVLRQIVDVIRFRRPNLLDLDPYGRAITHLTEAVMAYTQVRRTRVENAQATPSMERRAG